MADTLICQIFALPQVEDFERLALEILQPISCEVIRAKEAQDLQLKPLQFLQASICDPACAPEAYRVGAWVEISLDLEVKH